MVKQHSHQSVTLLKSLGGNFSALRHISAFLFQQHGPLCETYLPKILIILPPYNEDNYCPR